MSEHNCQTNHTIWWNNSGIISTNWPYRDRQRLYFERLGHINSVKLPLTVIMAAFYLTLIYTTLIIINN